MVIVHGIVVHKPSSSSLPPAQLRTVHTDREQEGQKPISEPTAGVSQCDLLLDEVEI